MESNILDTKYLRIHFWLNCSPTLQGTIGFEYDSYRNMNGPETFDLWFYFFGFHFQIGPRFKLEELEK